MAHFNPAMLPYLPNPPDHMARETNTAFWIEKGDELGARFTAWHAK
ncbi:hypothetical protein ACVWWO_003293 [Bradyrhizobium sp. F1.13.1]